MFNCLLSLTNMPIQRLGSMLVSKGRFRAYMALLKGAHQDASLAGVTCRNLLSVGWDG